MEPKLVLFVFLLISAAATCEYIRPPPRKTLHFPWNSKLSSHPQQVHISLAGDKHMRVSWVSNDKSTLPMVEYGTFLEDTATSLKERALRIVIYFIALERYTTQSLGRWKITRFIYYRCGGGGPEYKLKTPPAQFPVMFAVAGDLGQTGWTKSTLDHIDLCKYDVHLLPGDLSYADYIQHRWDTFGELVEPLASARPWMVTQGNHEKESIMFFKDGFQSYNSRWKMPYEESGSSSNLYYSFEVAGAHIIMLGSYTDYDEHSDQYNWLKADVANVDRKKTPWLIVLFHVPWYNSNEAHQDEGDRMLAAMEPLLHAASVDIVLAGHVHAYERTERVNKGKLDPCGAVHITIGDGGNREGLASKYKNPQPAWSVFREASFGHGELKLANSTHAYWSWHRNDDDESVRSDQVWITSLENSGCIAEKKHELMKILSGP
ncbi:purple acid phosphatase 18 [Populus alba x Populus x berolinensis]|nr:purple acid phosphatase 18 [Populus alba x Populus x berolinensis]